MFNFVNQRRAWDDLIIVFLKCGCSGAGLTISAAMAMTRGPSAAPHRQSAAAVSEACGLPGRSRERRAMPYHRKAAARREVPAVTRLP